MHFPNPSPISHDFTLPHLYKAKATKAAAPAINPPISRRAAALVVTAAALLVVVPEAAEEAAWDALDVVIEDMEVVGMADPVAVVVATATLVEVDEADVPAAAEEEGVEAGAAEEEEAASAMEQILSDTDWTFKASVVEQALRIQGVAFVVIAFFCVTHWHWKSVAWQPAAEMAADRHESEQAGSIASS